MKGKWGIIITVLLVAGAIAAVVEVQRVQNLSQHASQFSQVNTGADIMEANNPDGTMGPATSAYNFSNTLPTAYLGTLNLSFTDPTQGRMPADRIPSLTVSPSSAQPTQAGQDQGKPSTTPGDQGNRPSTTPGQGGANGGPQTVTSLVLTIAKAEVHLAHLGIPGEKNEVVSPTARPTGAPTGTPRNNQNLDKWETLSLNGVPSIDLVALAKTHSLQSLGLTKLANGRYTEIRVYVKLATAVLADGTKVTLSIPGRANTVRIVEPFVIDSAKTTTLTLDFDAQNSVIKAGDQYLLNPVVAHMLQENQQ